jgi:hypothetical protein
MRPGASGTILGSMAWRYVLTDAETGETVGAHRTKRAAIDDFATPRGRRISLFRTYSTGDVRLMAEGVWHQGEGLTASVRLQSP